ncbi:apolipoprotein N-acyltransferase, partial [Candidatus Poribacteria bacterium]|nr:apolipoprotein N-acyltransferase [Candidatus Poribacteria bacterium]
MAELRTRPDSFVGAFASALLLRFCFTPIEWWPIAFVALVPWLWGLRRTSPRAAFWLSGVFGAAHTLTLFTWLPSLSRFSGLIYAGIPLLCLWQGLHFAAVGCGLIVFARRFPPLVTLVLGSLWWAGWEWFRMAGQLGLPYGFLGHAVQGCLPLLQVTSLGGLPLLGALVLAFNLSIMETIAASKRRMVDAGVLARIGGVAALIAVACLWGASVMRLTANRAGQGVSLRVALVQPNISQDEKFASYASPDLEARREIQDRMTVQLLKMLDQIEPGSVDVVITPESAFTQDFFDMEEDVQRELRDRARQLGAPLLGGANDVIFVREDGSHTEDPAQAAGDGGFPRYEMAGGLFVFRPGDQERHVAAEYRKTHLMPFGETVPYLNLIPSLQSHALQFVHIGAFVPGESRQPPLFIHLKPPEEEPLAEPEPVHFGPTICFEDLFPYMHRRLARRGAQVFINVTNDAWYDPSLGSRFHFNMVPARCAETRLPMIRVTNTGVSAVLDGTGRILD